VWRALFCFFHCSAFVFFLIGNENTLRLLESLRDEMLRHFDVQIDLAARGRTGRPSGQKKRFSLRASLGADHQSRLPDIGSEASVARMEKSAA
jgi:hypothetical protein